MTHDPQLATHVAIFKRVRDQIAAEADLDKDDEAVLGSAEGETDLVDYLSRLLRLAEDSEALAKGLADLIKKRQERKARLERRAERFKRIVHNAMTDAGLLQMAAPDFTASRRPGRAPLIISDEAAVPDAYCKIDRAPKRKEIADAIRAGAEFDFAFLGNPSEQLTIRSA